MKEKVDRAAKKKGRVLQFNVSPKGIYEGLLIKTVKGNVQMNFPPEFAEEVASLAAAGQDVTALGVLEESREGAGHPVYSLSELHGAGDRKLLVSGKAADELAKGAHAFDGIAKQLNYAKHGEVNGAILDSGDFIHLKPHGAREIQLKVGQKLKGRGSSRPMAGGGVVVEAEIVNGIALKGKKKHAH